MENSGSIRGDKFAIDKDSHLLYDGYLHIPELGILIQPSIAKSVDAHGLGRENNYQYAWLITRCGEFEKC